MRAPSRQQVERQLVAITAADIAGYSRLMGADEEGTLARLRACSRELIEPGVARHRGRIVKTTGDGLLVEFVSPVEAVRCAVEWQQGMIARDADLQGDKRLQFRIGINLGDVIVDDKDLYGDAVNIAARLESLAEPGGICISRTVHEQIRDRLALPFADGGEESVKNISRPIRVFALSAEAIAALPKAGAPPARRLVKPLYVRAGVLAGSLAALVVITGSLWFLRPSPNVSSASAAPPAATVPTAAPRLSIVVLPFADLSDDRGQEYLADGIVDDLTTDLSRIAGSFVISRNSAFTYKGKAVDTKQIGRDLGVRYVLEGSVRRSAARVRVNAQLVDAETGAHIWADRFDRDLGDLFTLQNEITGPIAHALQSQLVIAEAGRSTDHPDAQEYILRGRAALTKPMSRETYTEAESQFAHALALDPRATEAQIGLARVLVSRALIRLSNSRTADIERADDLLAKALSASPNSSWAHYVKGVSLMLQFRYEEAILEYNMAIGLDRNFADAYAYLGWCKLVTGSLDEVISLLETAIRLSPHDPTIATWYFDMGVLHLLKAQIEEAVGWFEKARSTQAGYAPNHGWLAAAYALKGETERATAELKEAQRGGWVFSSMIRVEEAPSSQWLKGPKIRAMADATFIAGLRKAGMPEE